VPGDDLTLTIDSDLQKMAAERLGEESGSVVVVDIFSGEILVLASTPSSQPPSLADAREARKGRTTESLRKLVRDTAEALGPRDLEALALFAEFLRSRRAARSFAHHAEASHEAHGAAGEAPAKADGAAEPAQADAEPRG